MDFANAATFFAAALWAQVTPQTMLEPVPSFAWTGIPGAVQPAEYRLSKPVEACPLRDDQGRVVGVSLTPCRESK